MVCCIPHRRRFAGDRHGVTAAVHRLAGFVRPAGRSRDFPRSYQRPQHMGFDDVDRPEPPESEG